MGNNTITISRRSDALSRERLRSLRATHEKAAGGFAAALGELLRRPVAVELVEIEQLSYGRFIGKLDRISYFNHLRADPPGETLLLDVELPLAYAMIDRLLGGGREDESPPRRPLSDIEAPLAARIVRLFLAQLALAWRNVAELKFEVIQAESNPRLSRHLTTDETTVSADFQLTVGQRRGMMRLCMPVRAIQRLDAGRTADPEAPGTDDSSAAGTESTGELCVTLATTPITAADLAALQPGDIVVTETEAGSPALVSYAGGPEFLARPGVCRGKMAVRITRSVGECNKTTRHGAGD